MNIRSKWMYMNTVTKMKADSEYTRHTNTMEGCTTTRCACSHTGHTRTHARTHRSVTGGLLVEDTLSGQTGVTANVCRDTRDGVGNKI